MTRLARYSALALLVVIVAMAGCATIMSSDALIEGRVLLEGLPNGELGGTLVVLDGDFKVTTTEPDGKFAFEGEISGGDEFEIVISRDGYQSWQVTGTLEYDTEADVSITSVGTITLPKI